MEAYDLHMQHEIAYSVEGHEGELLPDSNPTNSQSLSAMDFSNKTSSDHPSNSQPNNYENSVAQDYSIKPGQPRRLRMLDDEDDYSDMQNDGEQLQQHLTMHSASNITASMMHASRALHSAPATRTGNPADIALSDDDNDLDDADDDDDEENGANDDSQNDNDNNDHSPKKPFPCPMCGRRFRLQTQLNSHNEIVHLKRRPFACKVCSIDFSCRGNFTKHCETKLHQRKAQELVDSGVNVTPEMILSGEALKVHLAKMKAEAKSQAKKARTKLYDEYPPLLKKRLPSLDMPIIASRDPAGAAAAARHRTRNTTPSSTTSSNLSASASVSMAPSSSSTTILRMGNGGNVTPVRPHHQQSTLNYAGITAAAAASDNNNNRGTKRVLDDVDEYQRLVAELNACKSTLGEVQKHCKKLQTEKEKLEFDHPVMRERIDSLTENVRFKSCLLKKLDARKCDLLLCPTANEDDNAVNLSRAALIASINSAATAAGDVIDDNENDAESAAIHQFFGIQSNDHEHQQRPQQQQHQNNQSNGSSDGTQSVLSSPSEHASQQQQQNTSLSTPNDHANTINQPHNGPFFEATAVASAHDDALVDNRITSPVVIDFQRRLGVSAVNDDET